MTTSLIAQRPTVVVATMLAAAVAACSSTSTPSGLGKPDISLSADTVAGAGSLAELQQRRAAWVARGIDNYRYELRISCFCAGDIRRPVLVEVRSGAVSKVWDLETARPVADVTPYPTITGLYDKAVEMRSGGGHVSVAYDTNLGFPARLEVGTIANDAGILYYIGAVTNLGR